MKHSKPAPSNAPLQRFAIIGAARSGLSAARFLLERGAQVFISDTCAAEKLDMTLAANDLAQVPHEAVEHSERVLESQVIVLSPGVPSDLPILKRARKAGIPVWSEIELAFRNTPAKVLAVTGSSGKSTTVSLLGSVLEAASIPTAVVGNIGIPAISVLPRLGSDAWAVLEASSFQLETIDSFRPSGAAIVNLMKNHLDRYANEQEYYAAKKHIARNMTRDDVLVLNADDAILAGWTRELRDRVRVVTFGLSDTGRDGVWYDDGTIFGRKNGEKVTILGVNAMKLRGVHNYLNASVAAALAWFCADVPIDALVRGLASFAGLAHRLEFVGEVGGVKFFNDSKSTTAESMVCALRAFDGNVYLIAGGRDKGCDFALVTDEIRARAKGLYLIGEARKRMHREWGKATAVFMADSLEQAVARALERATAGDAVVLSPGCASFDMFKNYEHRGDVFRAIVKSLTENAR